MTPETPLAKLSALRPPRSVRLRATPGLPSPQVAIAIYGLGPIVFSVYLLGILAFATVLGLTAYGGADVQGRVVGKEVRMEGKRGDIPTYYITTLCDYQGLSSQQADPVTKQRYDEARAGDPVAFKARAYGPFLHVIQVLVIPPPDEARMLALASLPGLAFLVLPFGYTLAGGLRLWRNRRLVRDGSVAAGRIIEKGGRRVSYSFRRPQGEETGSMRLSKSEFEACLPDQEVVVLYYPERPSRSVIYEYSGFEAGGPEKA